MLSRSTLGFDACVTDARLFVEDCHLLYRAWLQIYLRRRLKPSIWRISLNIGACDGPCVKLASGSGLSARARWQSQSCGGHAAAYRCFAIFVTSASARSSRQAKSRPMGAKQRFVHGNKRSFGSNLWKSRSLRHRLEHRWNVTRLAHHAAHGVVRVDVGAPGRGPGSSTASQGMVVVCPAAAQEYFAPEMDERTKLGTRGRGSQDRLFS